MLGWDMKISRKYSQKVLDLVSYLSYISYEKGGACNGTKS